MPYNKNKLIELQNRFKSEVRKSLNPLVTKYEKELLTLVQSELSSSHYICSAMGGAFKCSMIDIGKHFPDDDFIDILNEIVWGNNIRVNLDLTSSLIKAIKVKLQDIIDIYTPEYLISGMALGIDTLWAKMAIENNIKIRH